MTMKQKVIENKQEWIIRWCRSTQREQWPVMPLFKIWANHCCRPRRHRHENNRNHSSSMTRLIANHNLIPKHRPSRAHRGLSPVMKPMQQRVVLILHYRRNGKRRLMVLYWPSSCSSAHLVRCWYGFLILYCIDLFLFRASSLINYSSFQEAPLELNHP